MPSRAAPVVSDVKSRPPELPGPGPAQKASPLSSFPALASLGAGPPAEGWALEGAGTRPEERGGASGGVGAGHGRKAASDLDELA